MNLIERYKHWRWKRRLTKTCKKAEAKGKLMVLTHNALHARAELLHVAKQLPPLHPYRLEAVRQIKELDKMLESWVSK